jgi:DNA mismatch repair protein MutL
MVRITDDGEGMSRDDAVLSVERHATSKIRTLEDLAGIGTLGFRGEALASIASVARVEVLTKRPEDEIATRLLVEGGRLTDIRDAARDHGTTITVRDLFFNTPARRKFMRSEATENYHLTNIVQHYALVNPEIAFKLTNNGREVLRVSPAKDLRERAFQIFGVGLLESLVPVDGGREFIAKVTGYVSAPRERRTTRDAQYFFVNRRFVRDKTIADGLREAYRSVLPQGVYPVAFLFLDIPPDEIDVNVHPAKTEIRFRRTEAVKDVIAEAVREALTGAGIVGDALPDAAGPTAEQPVPGPEPVFEQAAIEFRPGPSSEKPAAEAAAVEIADQVDVAEMLDDISKEFTEAAAAVGTLFPTMPAADPVSAFSRAPSDNGVIQPPKRETSFPPLNSGERYVRKIEDPASLPSSIHPLGQLHESYIIAADNEGLLLIDQHVAHERILFDKFRRAEAGKPSESQNLLLPETLDLTAAQGEAFNAVESELKMLGFSVMRLSGRTIAIKSVPSAVSTSESRNLFAEILDSIDLDKRGRAKATLQEEVAASLACKAAIKINMKLTFEKMQWLIDRLLLTDSPTTCPHGRPIILRISMGDIERGFHRT